jgi:DNA-binding MarR family transcriptional regulator
VSDAKQAIRDLRMELAALNHQVSVLAGLKDSDLDCLDVVVREGPLSPSALARRTGLHAATMTGILSRLESGGWVTREQVEGDRRSVVLRAVPERVREVFGHYEPMNVALDDLLASYSDEELTVIVDFLRRSGVAGREVASSLVRKR